MCVIYLRLLLPLRALPRPQFVWCLLALSVSLFSFPDHRINTLQCKWRTKPPKNMI